MLSQTKEILLESVGLGKIGANSGASRSADFTYAY